MSGTQIADRQLKEAYIKQDGTRAFTGPQSMGGNKLTNIANGTNSTDAVNKGQLDSAIAGITSGMEYKGTFDASAGNYSAISNPKKGWFYRVSVAGVINSVDYQVGDNIIINKDVAGSPTASDVDKIDNTDAVSTSTFVTRETPTGLVNGTNTVYTLAYTPISGTEHVYLNGILQEPGAGNDYTVSGNQITMLTAPTTGEKIRVSYLK